MKDKKKSKELRGHVAVITFHSVSLIIAFLTFVLSLRVKTYHTIGARLQLMVDVFVTFVDCFLSHLFINANENKGSANIFCK